MSDTIDITKYNDVFKVKGLFTAEHVHTFTQPHPFCVTPQHVGHASDHFSGMLGSDAILDLEKKTQKPSCGMYVSDDGKVHNGYKRGYHKCDLMYDEHVSKNVLIVKLTRDMTNAEAGTALCEVKPMMEADKFEGVGFLNLNKEFRITA